jgi:RHS repeat-associated protein
MTGTRGRIAIGRALAGRLAALALLLVGTSGVVLAPGAAGAPGAAAAAGEDPPAGLEDGPWDESAAPATEPWEDSPTLAASGPERQPAPPETDAAEYPDAGDWEVSLAEPGAMGEVVGDDEAGPVEVGVAEKRADGRAVSRAVAGRARGKDLRLTVHDRATAERAGVTGFVFEVEGDGSAESAGALVDAGDVPLELGLDYSGFAGADVTGAGATTDLRVVALPACAIENPVPAGCDTTGVPVASTDDPEGERLLVDRADLAAVGDRVAEANAELQALPSTASAGILDAAAAGAADVRASAGAPARRATPTTTTAARSAAGDATVFAVTASASGAAGTYEATPMSMSGEWSVSAGSGEFSSSYPLDLPAPPAGKAPALGTGYSSGAVDGLTHSSNPQASQVGLGWSDFADAFIERSYESCAEAEVLPSALWGQLCFKDHNATISLGGVSGRLIPIDANLNATTTQWRVQGDPGWRIERTALPDPNQSNYLTRESWKVTAPDGTQYFFGLHTANPDASEVTNSVWWVPVTSDHAGDPCWATAANHWNGCNMAYRWMLDRVVDPDGNLTTYYYERETNNYNAWPGVADKVTYIRSGWLERVEYGGRAGAGPTQKPAVRISFDVQNRCWYLVAACGPATSGNAASFFDVPNNLICDTQASCSHGTPTFFSTKRYAAVRTDVLVGSAYQRVGRYDLTAKWANTSDETGASDEMMYLDWAQQVGTTDGVAYPRTSFDYSWMRNVVSRQTHAAKLWRARLSRVVNPYGGQILVTYSPDNCAATYQPPGGFWDANNKPCFPQMFKDKKSAITEHGIFHKYRVQRVDELPGYGADAMVTQYAYIGDPAWAHNRRMSDGDQVKWNWNVWRGYGEVEITKGTAASGLGKTRLRLYRGMVGDLKMTSDGCVCARRGPEVNPKHFDNTASPQDDLWWMAGRTLEEQQRGTIGTVTNTPVTSTRYTYVKSDLIAPGDPREEFRPTFAAVADVTERVWSSATAYRERGTTTTYNPNFQPATTLAKGWLDTTVDDRCSVTTYADNPAKGMFSYPWVNETREGANCATGTALSRSETAYDLGAFGAAPDRGNPTTTRTKIDATRWSSSSMTYDGYGRPLVATDAAGGTSTTVYTPATNVFPTKTEVTNSVGFAHKITTEWHPIFGTPTKEIDANLNTTTWQYDGLGRTSQIRRPTEQTTQDPSFSFSYTLDTDSDADLLPEKPPVVKSRQLQIYGASGGVFEDGWVVFDGFMRERQTQALSPEAGKVLVSETRYDARGLVREDILPEPVTGTAGSGMLAPTTWQNRTRFVYDELGRQTRAQWITPGTTSTVESETVTSYGPDTVTVEGPEGGAVRETVDGLGRTVEVEEREDRDGDDWASTRYEYDLADQLRKVIDPADNETTYTYNLAGWRTAQTDPDRGAARFEYDVAGRQTMAEDAAGRQIHNKYDILGRPTERRSGSPTGTLLASWTYDSVKKGLLTKATRHTPTGAWETIVNTYDEKNQPTSTSLRPPAGIPGISGRDYTVTSKTDRADHPYEVGYPAVGGLAAETVRSGHNGFGLPATLTSGLADYVWATQYDPRARPVVTSVGPKRPSAPYEIGTAHVAEYNNEQQLQRSYTAVLDTSWPGNLVSERVPSYRDDGTITAQDTRLNGQTWRECYGYDDRNRLTDTYTVNHGATCTAANAGGGDQPFERSYDYSIDGRLESRSEDGVPTAYSYPDGGAGSVRPHAPDQVGTRDYTWNTDGSLKDREVAGGTETFNWDVEHLLSSVSGPGGTTGFVYDVGGQRLLRTDPDGTKTLYFAGHEVTASANGSTVTAVRSYSHNGQLIATRSPAGVDYLVTDGAGSVEASLPSGAMALSGTRRYDPYGQVRSETGSAFKTDRGFAGQVEDSTTSLSYMNARYYDAEAALFVSTDPLFDSSQPKSLNPYTYGLGNPTSFTDPSGLASSPLWGTEVENNALRGTIRDLNGVIDQMNVYIAGLQDIIRDQQKVITDLFAENRALRTVIDQQQVVIGQLRARVSYLEGQVAYWRGEAAKWKSRAQYWKGRAMYFSGVIKNLVGLAYRPPFHQSVLDSIWAGNGVPKNLWLGTYAALSISLQMSAPRRFVNTFQARERGRATVTEWNLRDLPGPWIERSDEYYGKQLPIEWERRVPFRYERGATTTVGRPYGYNAHVDVFEPEPGFTPPPLTGIDIPPWFDCALSLIGTGGGLILAPPSGGASLFVAGASSLSTARTCI